VLVHILLNITRCDFELFQSSGGAGYIRVLGFLRDKRELVSELAEKSRVPVIMNLKKDREQLGPVAAKMLDLDITAAHVYNIGCNGNPGASEYSAGLVIV